MSDILSPMEDVADFYVTYADNDEKNDDNKIICIVIHESTNRKRLIFNLLTKCGPHVVLNKPNAYGDLTQIDDKWAYLTFNIDPMCFDVDELEKILIEMTFFRLTFTHISDLPDS